MAKPRVFISSTYFDLKNVRADLERFVKSQGYDPILNERGQIAYGNKEKLEEYCYKEIQISDILISIVGGRYGSQSKIENHSISNAELKIALEHNEYRTYERNKEIEGISYASVDDTRIFNFIEEIQSLPINNTIASFETSSDITDYLREQWAGLFQRLLSEHSKQKELIAINEIKSTAKTLNQLVSYLIEERKNGDQAFKEILRQSIGSGITRAPLPGNFSLDVPYGQYGPNPKFDIGLGFNTDPMSSGFSSFSSTSRM